MSPVTKRKAIFSWRWLSAELKRREVYPVIVAFIVAFTWLGVRGFTRRVVS